MFLPRAAIATPAADALMTGGLSILGMGAILPVWKLRNQKVRQELFIISRPGRLEPRLRDSAIRGPRDPGRADGGT